MQVSRGLSSFFLYFGIGMHATTKLKKTWGRSTVVATTCFSNLPRFLFLVPAPPSLPLSPDLSRRRRSNAETTQPIQSYSYHSSSSSSPQKKALSSSSNSLYDGREEEVGFLHAQAIKTGYAQDLTVCNHLLTLYLRFPSTLACASQLFDEMPVRDVRTWTILITSFARMGSSKMALDIFIDMQMEGVHPNHFTLSCVLKCCATVENLDMGKKIHGWILRNGVRLDVALENSLLHLCVKCGEFDYAKSVFGSMGYKDTLSWNIMIDGYLQVGDTESALELFSRVPSKDAASWNTIIVGLMRNGCHNVAVELLYKMITTGLVFNQVTFSIALFLAASLSILELGRQIHGKVLRIGFDQDGFIKNSLIDMYCKCGNMDMASKIFSRKSKTVLTSMACPFGSLGETVFSWSSLISGHVQNGRTEDALELFCRMVCEGVEVDRFTLTSITAACADVGIVEQGRQIHAFIEKLGHKFDDFLVSAIVDMYAKCGKLNDALSIFHQSNSRNVVLWTSMISGCALHGQGREAIQLFQLMLEKGISPNEISFVGVLSGCSHAGLVEEGRLYFRLMQDYGIIPKLEHLTCMVDLLGRAGCLDDAKEFIYGNGISHQSVVWRAFLSACRVHKNIQLGKLASEQLLKLEPLNAGSYVLLSNICATTDRWKEAADTRTSMQKRGVKKHPGQSWIRLKNRVHTFVVGDRSHPQAADIYSFLERLMGRLKEVGYLSDTELTMHDVEEEQREVLLGFHSEKLAIAYGIMSTPCGSPILVMKNLRVCVDCHNAIKYISEITGREITVRDARRFHHFKDGCCSCGDYW